MTEKTPCVQCGGGCKSEKKHPITGEMMWLCSKCRQDAYETIQELRKVERIAAMTPERRAQYDKNRQGYERGLQRKIEGMNALLEIMEEKEGK